MEATPPVGRRERKRQEVRDRLLDAAIELFVANGVEATTMDAIAERADVARTTVFNHYPQKVTFLEEWGARRRARVAALLSRSEPADSTTEQRLRHYLRELASISRDARRETTILLDAADRFGGLFRDPSLDTELSKILGLGVERGDLRADIDPNQVGELLAAGYFSTVLRWVSVEPAPFPLLQRVDQMLDIVLDGILTR